MRFRDSLAEQLKRNTVALISLVFAMTTLGYTSWRMEHSEENQNIRAAGFEILMQLGKLQLNVDYSYYGEDDERGNPISAWTHVLLIRDLSRIMPGDMPDKADTPELQVMGAEARQKRIDTLFGDDEEAMMVLMSRYDGYEPNEICKICEIDRTRYASVLRRIRRTMERQELEGGNDEQ